MEHSSPAQCTIANPALDNAIISTSCAKYFDKKILYNLIDNIPNHSDQISLSLACRKWSIPCLEAMYHSPPLQNSDSFERMLSLLNTPLPYINYTLLIKELNISSVAADNIYMGDLDFCLAACPNLELFRLENCYHISNILVQSLSQLCKNLLQLELSGCPISDTFIKALTKNCKSLQRLDLSFTNITITSLFTILTNSKNLVSLDICECREADSELNDLLVSEGSKCNSMKYLNLRNSPISDELLIFVSDLCPNLEDLILDSAVLVTDKSLVHIIAKCLRLKSLDLSFCDKITDVTLYKLYEISLIHGSDLKSLYLSAVDFISTDAILKVILCCKNLSLLILDGCVNITGSFIQKEFATFKEDLECTLEKDAIRLLYKHASTLFNTPPVSPKKVNDTKSFRTAGEEGELKVQVSFGNRNSEKKSKIFSPPTTPPRIISKRSSMRMLRSQSLLIGSNTNNTSKIINQEENDYFRHERQEKIREKRKSKTLHQMNSVYRSAPSNATTSSENLDNRFSSCLLTEKNQNDGATSFSMQQTSSYQFVPPQIKNYDTNNSASSNAVSETNAPVVLASGRAARKAQMLLSQQQQQKTEHEGNENSNLNDATSVLETASEDPPQKDSGVIIASGRRRRPQSEIASKSSNLSASSQPFVPSEQIQHPLQRQQQQNNDSAPEWNASTSAPPATTTWGAAPPMWTNPAQMTSASSTWSASIQPVSTFADPWASAPPPQNSSTDPWAAAPSSMQPPPPAQYTQQPMTFSPNHYQNESHSSIIYQSPQHSSVYQQPIIYQSNGFQQQNNFQPVTNSNTNQLRVGASAGWAGEQDQNHVSTTPIFIYSNSNRGRMLLKLRIETKKGGHQTLEVHELDDPNQLSQEFCDFWQMGAFKDPLVRLISVRKSNALRQRGIAH
ncbi:hypothetical protein HDU92_005560 [Lobulomyces angularis]|nr:hypothetical protein HDU92_005560 [Lobulomyces angularis]